MPLYTIALEFQGGTYISQLMAESERTAIDQWAQTLSELVPNISSTDRKQLGEEFKYEELAPLDGLVNTWCTSALVNGDLALLNLIKTDDTE